MFVLVNQQQQQQKILAHSPGVARYLFFYFILLYYIYLIKFISKLIFATDARELGAREVAPDALLVKLPKKSKKSIKNRKKVLVDLAVTSQCRTTFLCPTRRAFQMGVRVRSGYAMDKDKISP